MTVIDVYRAHYRKSIVAGYYGDEYIALCGRRLPFDERRRMTRIVGEVTCKHCNRLLSSYIVAKDLERQ